LGFGEIEFIEQHPSSGPQCLRNDSLCEAPTPIPESFARHQEGALGQRQFSLIPQSMIEQCLALGFQPWAHRRE
jgi:hypothetical protein